MRNTGLNLPKPFIFVAVIFLCFAGGVRAQSCAGNTCTAASCSSTDVQNAINATSTTYTNVAIPSCPSGATWTSGIKWTLPSTGTYTLIGAGYTPGGTDQTLITDDITRNPGNNCNPDPATIAIITGSASSIFRMSGFSIQNTAAASAQTCTGLVRITGATQNLRVDHMHFNTPNQDSTTMAIGGWIYGVVDHSQWEQIEQNQALYLQEGQYGGSASEIALNVGDGAWADTTGFGSSRFIFVENNVFNGGTVEDCNHGCRMVVRYNTMNSTSPSGGAAGDTHCTGCQGRARGARAVEWYNNTMNGSSSMPEFNAFFLSSGTGLFWGNSVTGYETLLGIREQRADGDYTESAPPNGWGWCGTANTGKPGTGSAWDFSATTATGYPCIDQPGRGMGDLLQGQFPNACDVTNGACAASNHNGTWVNDALDPIYEWMDGWLPVSGYPYGVISVLPGVNITNNQDYYTGTLTWNGSVFTGTAFNGTVGTGWGLLSARPSTCAAGPGGTTPGVAYWATDTSTLYVCNPTNVWTTYYTPYTYPYPLTQSLGTPPAAPTNLSATVQ
jgi:hypothetical protein